jgi:HK97 family phage prohead protease
MPGEVFEYKTTTLGQVDAKSGSINLDEAQGIVECFVAGIGNKDSVGDIVASGAFTKSLMRRKPRVVWGHNWNDPIGKVLEIYEVSPSDNRLPLKMKMAGIGGLFARVQFNLQSEKGREAFANVAFFGEEQEWSIGYKTLRAQYDQKSQANVIYELELYEVSPVLHGANQLTGTISVKSDEKGGMMAMAPMSPMDEDETDEIQKQLSMVMGSKIMVDDVADDMVTFSRRETDGKVGKYKCHYSRGPAGFMFGPPQRVVMPKPMGMPMPQGMPMPPGMPMAMPEPPRMIRPSQMPGIPVAIKPGESGMRAIPLPPVEYEDSDRKPRAEFDKNNLDQEEADLRDALLKITKRYGKFNEDSEGVWAGYKSADENPVKQIGVKCANCVFFKGGNSCEIIDMEIESEGKCRFAVIPKGVVTGDVTLKKVYEYENAVDEIEYLEDLEVKYPGELIIAALRGAVGRRRKKRRKYKSLAEFGIEDEDPNSPYCIPVLPQYAFAVKQALDPIFDYHYADSFVDSDGIVITSGVSYELIDAVDTAIENLKKKNFQMRK